LGNDILKFENNHNQTSDRRKISAPILHDKRCGKDRRMSFREKLQNEQGLVYALEALPPIRRIASLPDKLDSGDIVPALGMASLAFINLPEDLRDIKNAAGQIASFAKGNKHMSAYDYKNFQNEFSFFRGTLFDHIVDFSKAHKHPEVDKLLSVDKSILRTSFGQKVLDFFKVTYGPTEAVKSFNKEKNVWEVAKDYKGHSRHALSFSGGWLGKLTARAMARTTLIGTIVIAALEIPKIFNSMLKGDDITETAGGTAIQLTKSAINVAVTTAGIAYGGAIGSKCLKSFGSLLGMGVGAIVGTTLSKKIQEGL